MVYFALPAPPPLSPNNIKDFFYPNMRVKITANALNTHGVIKDDIIRASRRVHSVSATGGREEVTKIINVVQMPKGPLSDQLILK